MTSIRDITQDYAQGAIKTAVLLNSGAIIAGLSQLGELSRISEGGALGRPFAFWVMGALLGAICWFLAFVSARYLMNARRRSISTQTRNRDIEKSNALLALGILAYLVSLACFGAGAFSIVLALP
ncbi:MAG: hypothetical protein ACXIU8_04155 [Alkalilacustris sp.]